VREKSVSPSARRKHEKLVREIASRAYVAAVNVVMISAEYGRRDPHLTTRSVYWSSRTTSLRAVRDALGRLRDRGVLGEPEETGIDWDRRWPALSCLPEHELIVLSAIEDSVGVHAIADQLRLADWSEKGQRS
jgi:hypothetical protein